MAEDGRRNPLQWEGGYWNSAPVWPREPDLAVIRFLAQRQLAPHVPVALKDAAFTVSFFAGGAFNKLYLVSYAGLSTSYIFRVSLPVYPFFKTESEAATLTRVRADTSIPVPRVFAWDSSPDNELGFEWILMEKLAGVPLMDVWRKIEWTGKLVLIESLAGLINQLGNHKFDRIGSLYFKLALKDCNGDLEDERAGGDTPENQGHTPMAEERVRLITGNASLMDFAIGSILSPIFYLDNRLYLPGNRGPYRSASEWLRAEIEMQLRWVKRGLIEGDRSYAKDFEKEAPDIETECHRYLQIIPTIFRNEEDSSYRLHHADLTLANILVDPESFEITGIVDWELINIVPSWKASDYPVFLQDIEPQDEEEPPIPSYEDEEDLAVYTRDQWDHKILRRHYDAVMERLQVAEENSNKAAAAKKKREFRSEIQNLSDNISWAQDWLEAYVRSLQKELEKDRDIDGVVH